MVTVKVYSTTWCPWCKKVKEWLVAHKIQYKDIDIEKDPDAAKEMVSKSGQTGIPVTEIDGEIIVGYDVARLKKALKLKE